MTGHDVAEEFVALTDREKDIKRAIKNIWQLAERIKYKIRRYSLPPSIDLTEICSNCFSFGEPGDPGWEE